MQNRIVTSCFPVVENVENIPKQTDLPCINPLTLPHAPNSRGTGSIRFPVWVARRFPVKQIYFHSSTAYIVRTHVRKYSTFAFPLDH